MVSAFSFQSANKKNMNNCNRRPAEAAKPLQEMEWPRLGGGTVPTQKKPAAGFNALAPPPMPANNSLAGLPTTRTTAASGTAKGGLALLLAASRPVSRVPSEAGDIAAERAVEQQSAQRGRKKKPKKKKGADKAKGVSTACLEKPDFLLPRTLKASPSIASLNAEVVAEKLNRANAEYTWSFKKRDPALSASSAGTSPSESALTSLLNQAHPGDMLTVDGSGSDSEEPLVSYEVAIDQDYISKEVDSRSTSRTASPSRKKMTADDFEVLKCLGKGA